MNPAVQQRHDLERLLTCYPADLGSTKSWALGKFPPQSPTRADELPHDEVHVLVTGDHVTSCLAVGVAAGTSS